MSYNGIINIYKEQGYTSFDVVAKLRGILKMRKIGHTGTLDPDATGVLPVVLGSATKLVDMLTDKKKEYIATLRLGITTDTLDITGTVLSENTPDVSEGEVRDAILSFIGPQLQTPPMYSAIKVNGRKLYELAREGIEIERQKRSIEIFDIEILDMSLPDIRLRVECSKGTYIRSLCADIGDRLSCGAVMTSLMRTKSGDFAIDRAYTLREVEEAAAGGRVEEMITPVDYCFMDYAGVTVAGDIYKTVRNGNMIRKADIAGEMTEGDRSFVRIYDAEGNFLAVYETGKPGLYKVHKMFLSE
ncbi:MAG: tRNA pseudouridine(55) synthase TruB [Lachnospiraceae bacterium]|nr:tRNA pseudouridine(55) synthase TruB [Lachnospiraceae bacterium]